MGRGRCALGHVIAVVSGKGGTGKTSFAVNVAVSLCALGERVLLIDADAGLRSLDIPLGMTDSLLFTYADVIAGSVSLKEASVVHPIVRNLRVLTAPATEAMCATLTRAGIESLVRRARDHFAYTIIDCSAGLREDILCFAAAAGHAVIVSTGDQTALRAAQKTSALLRELGVSDQRLVVNRVRERLIDEGASATIDGAMDLTGLPLLGVVPEDRDVIVCANRGKLLLLESRGHARRAFLNIAHRLRGERVRLLYGIRGKLKGTY
ncbi:MAG: hypothetical protein ABT01_00965 [Clostridium sp. SCN 57-10]|nr:MAG: hypothetical protein ABT01_00965 [Clostridium sp. SCN 57-10]